MKKLIDMPCIVYKFYGSITFSIDFFFFLTILLQNLYITLDVSMN